MDMYINNNKMVQYETELYVYLFAYHCAWHTVNAYQMFAPWSLCTCMQ